MKSKLPIHPKYAYLAALILTLLMVIQTSDPGGDGLTINLNRIILFAANYLTWAIGLSWVHQYTSNLNFGGNNWRKEAIRLVFIALAISAIQLVLSNIIYYAVLAALDGFPFDSMVRSFTQVFIKAWASRLIDFIVIVGILRALSNYRKLNEQKLAVAELESVLTHTRLEALKMQLNPHFLFNSLHAIHSMIGYDNDKARSMLLKISNLLRKILELGEKQLISLNDELNYLKDYLDIEQERFHDRLQVHYHVEELMLTTLVPSLLLQPLAENALKHGISPMEEPGEINLHIRQLDSNRLELVMTNSMNEKQASPTHGTGIGLANLEKRLEQLYQQSFSLETKELTAQFSVKIIIPLSYEH
ncbi:MAG: histidine kinase [Roseivirga sp.]|nr:histidine kinase [Roseivirga sp.]